MAFLVFMWYQRSISGHLTIIYRVKTVAHVPAKNSHRVSGAVPGSKRHAD